MSPPGARKHARHLRRIEPIKRCIKPWGMVFHIRTNPEVYLMHGVSVKDVDPSRPRHSQWGTDRDIEQASAAHSQCSEQDVAV